MFPGNGSRMANLILGFNPINSLPKDVFSDMTLLESLHLDGIVIDNIDVDHFIILQKLKFIYFIKFRYCHFAAHVRVCRPITDGLSSAKHLLVFPVLRSAVWIVALVCCCGNIVVLIWRHISQRETKIVSIFIKNLSGRCQLYSIASYYNSHTMSTNISQSVYILHIASR